MAERLFTWVDVDAHLAQAAVAGEWPAWLLEADAWWDGLELSVRPGTETVTVRDWLDGLFGLGSTAEHDGVLELGLDRPSTHAPDALEVRLVEAGQREKVMRRPRLGERRVVRELGESLPRPQGAEFPGGKQLIAFHSFKGGVGRTLHAVALADHLATRGQHVLLVDADLEAPGITWMYQAQHGRCDIAYEDLLALLHSAQQGDATRAVEIAAAFLPNQRVSRYPGTGCVTVLPAGRRARLGPPRIAPADLLTEDRSPYFLSESLAALAVAAGADTVVLDLRAGASELAAPILLDPRVMRVFVTTISSQSLQGTETLIRQLGGQSPAVAGVDPAPGAVITQYRLDVHDGHAENARKRLSAALSTTFAVPETAGDGTPSPDELAVDEQVLTEPVLSPFREELLALPQSWDAVVEVVRRCGLPELLEEFAPGTTVAGAPEEEPDTLDGRRLALAASAGRLVFAERHGTDLSLKFLTTEPVRRLIADHSTDLPVAVVVGAKGSGKTFTFARMCAQKTWERFAAENDQPVQRSARVVPVLDPANIAEQGDASPQQLRDAVAGGVGITADEIRAYLNAGLRHERAEEAEFWRDRWLECLARAAGADEGDPSEDFLIWLNQAPDATLFVVDGLEDWLETLDSEPKRIALRALLMEVPAWLRRLRSRSLGLVVFVRQDLVRTAIRQNLGQFLARYSPYELRWDTEDALRLSLWVAVNAGAVTEPPRPIADMGFDEIVRALLPLWGAKLGTETSREAWTERWVPAALADFKEQIQARDIVRFLCEAAKASVGDGRWSDRVLAPAAMRRALGECSRAKVEEINQENPRLGKLLRHMSSFSESVKMPFEASDVELGPDDVEALEEWGALARDADGRYRMPEIYRHALGFRTQGRARVVRGL
ncbi:AAA family ATPase [Streptomyces sp. SID8366]|uniref:KGGVGR-motif variant AAA ATPase n=1 Tax=unclassified Streptomyces TaxID=2593676 RepID=UPI000DB9B174|nr:AAA family ATPase [Streptomyces sp. PsTaAH-130]MYU07764.1 AAA family ATPase [Streptomyces sp. SID8366]MYU64242.1 AAA family ATPase [Streptomyces sp. SID69]RAJ49596.1 cellulose biosynthesis protein BcsQ [Streptomyces sp. PsTaAH-130]